ncbi:TfoX family protein [bacterium]|nr:TfoX family protein [bacterium]
MPYDHNLAERVSKILSTENPAEKKMFGGVGYLINGNMACGVHTDNLIVRVGKDQYIKSLNLPHVKPFDLTGKAMSGWVEVLPAGTKDDNTLAEWIRMGVDFARTLPPK